MNKLAIILPIWKRPEVTKLCLDNLRVQSEKLNFDVIVCGSEGEESKQLAEGFKYIEVENVLSSKLNALLQECKEYDGVVLMGSDDFISDSIIKRYQKMKLDSATMYGFSDLHFYEVATSKFKTKGVYGGNMSIGVGRLFTKQLLEKHNYKLWEDGLMNGLDTSCKKIVGDNEKVFKYTKTYFILDVKHELNITKHNIINTCTEDSDLSLLDKFLHVKLDLEPSKNKKSIPRKKRKRKLKLIEVEFVKEVCGVKMGIVKLPETLAKAQVRKGNAKHK